MSDISGGTPIPKAVQSVSHGTDKATGVARDRQQANTPAKEEHPSDQKKPEQQAPVSARDPAVSISASAAHLHVGEELKQRVATVDHEGRPIIETETATFALRPDAGLKPGDDVTLVVKEADKQLTADLLKHNNLVIDPPVRLNLIVIAIHAIEPTTPAQHVDKPLPDNNFYKPAPNIKTPAAQAVDTETEALAKLLGRGSGILPQQKHELPATKTDTVQSPANLTALLSAQQTQAPTPTVPTEPIQPPLGNTGPQHHILQPTPLTEINAAQGVTSASGLGALIPAITTSGQNIHIQLIDPSVSKVAPAEIARVTTVKTLTPQDAKALPISVTALGNSGALAQIETNKGAFVLNQAAAQNLPGELVRISQPQAVQQQATPTQAPQSFQAKLIPPSGNQPQKVSVQFPEKAAHVAGQQQTNTVVTAVHTVRAFLTAEGPRNDIRLETPLGDLTLTLANSARPAPGDPVTILPSTQAAATVAGASAPIPVSASHWPTFEQAFSLLQTAGAAGASATQSLAARTAQGGVKLTNSAMFLMSALGGSNASNWLGKTAEQALADRNPQLLDRLKEDINRLFTIAGDTSGEWRALLLPLDTRSPDMPMVAFLFGQGAAVDPDKENKNDQYKGDDDEELKRFILEVQFSVLGPVQLDGMIRGQRFDLMIRSEKQFPPILTQETSELFSNALAAGAFTGSLGFSVEEKFPVDVNAVIAQKPALQAS